MATSSGTPAAAADDPRAGGAARHEVGDAGARRGAGARRHRPTVLATAQAAPTTAGAGTRRQSPPPTAGACPPRRRRRTAGRSARASATVLLRAAPAAPGTGCPRDRGGRARVDACGGRAAASMPGSSELRDAAAAARRRSRQARQQREDASWQGLVKLYESMKPRDAATIFNDLEMPVLLRVRGPHEGTQGRADPRRDATRQGARADHRSSPQLRTSRAAVGPTRLTPPDG